MDKQKIKNDLEDKLENESKKIAELQKNVDDILKYSIINVGKNKTNNLLVNLNDSNTVLDNSINQLNVDMEI